MMINNPHGYKQMVLDCVLASQRVEGILTFSAQKELISFLLSGIELARLVTNFKVRKVSAK